MSDTSHLLNFCEKLIDQVTVTTGYLSLCDENNSQHYLEQTRKELAIMAETVTSFIDKELK